MIKKRGLRNVVLFILAVTVIVQDGKGCLNTEFKCIDGSCIDGDYECDGEDDCNGGEDELACTGGCWVTEFKCNSGSCIDSQWRCDGYKDCTGGEDELNCSGNACLLTEFKCNDGKCIRSEYRCDGQKQCSGGEDELGCIVCSPTEMKCNDGSRCAVRCDGFTQCSGGEDERDCGACGNNFQCINGSCIDDKLMCNGHADCKSGEDEIYCIGSCSSTQLKCYDGSRCADRCDGYTQCDGGEDERDCGGFNSIDCTGRFPCFGGICVDYRSVCDGKRDCATGEDERFCGEIIPVLEVKNKNYTVKVGDKVTLECKVSNVSLDYTVYWQKNNTAIQAGTTGTQGMTKEFPSLTITSVTTSDAGVYTCNAATEAGTGTSEPVTLQVIGGIPEVSVGSSRYSVFIGDEITLQCTIKASPNVQVVYWQKETNLATTTYNQGAVGTEGITTFNPSLKIKASNLNDAGLYTCFGVNAVGTGQSVKVLLEVIGATPEVNVQLTNYEVDFGGLRKLVCTVNAKPAVKEVYWTKTTSGEIIKISAGTQGTGGITISDPSLIIIAARTTDNGLYKCNALNSVGIGISQGVNLTVRGGLPIVTVQSENYITDYNKTITLQCVVNSNPSANRVYWTKTSSGNVTIINRGAVGIEGLTISQPSLTIVSPIAGDSGQYSCYASNDVGTSNSRFTFLTVNGKDGSQNGIDSGTTTNPPGTPLVTITSNTYTVMFNAAITLECRVTGVYINRIFWRKNVNNEYKVLEYGTPGTTGISVTSPSLTIKNATQSDAGKYTCHAANYAGTGQSGYVTLNVIGDLPKVTIETTKSTAIFGERATLNCSIEAVPAVTHVYWQKTSSGITTIYNPGAVGILGVNVSYPSLVILSVSDAYEGNYSCYATNDIGTGHSMSVSLEVLAKKPYVAVDNDEYKVDYGKPVKLSCTIVAKPAVSQVYWTKYSNGERTEIPTGTAGTGGNSIDYPSLIINSTRTSDSGNYTCNAKNSVGVGSSGSVSLKVNGGLPIVKLEKDSYIAISGRAVALPCDIQAFPQLRLVYWKKETMGQITIINHGGVGIEGLSTDRPSLTLPSPSSADAGQYSCHATNEVGTSSSQQALLQVLPEDNNGGSEGTTFEKTGQWVDIVGGVIGGVASLVGIVGGLYACRRKIFSKKENGTV